jgi:hypothetical protein
MAAEERATLYEQGNNVLTLAQGISVTTKVRTGKRKFDKHVTPGKKVVTREDVQALIDTLKDYAQEIVDDFETQRENFGDAEGFLNSWEERAGYKSEGWEAVVDALDEIEVPEEPDRSDFEAEHEKWEAAEPQRDNYESDGAFRSDHIEWEEGEPQDDTEEDEFDVDTLLDEISAAWEEGEL